MRIILGVVIVGALLGGVSPRARADYYGSLAYDFSSGGYGVSHDYSSQESARANARAACQQKNAGYCKIVKTFDSCGALSVGANLEAYYGVGQNKELAAQPRDECVPDARSRSMRPARIDLQPMGRRRFIRQ
jgi:Domain of unknown function (DUF4189)